MEELLSSKKDTSIYVLIDTKNLVKLLLGENAGGGEQECGAGK